MPSREIAVLSVSDRMENQLFEDETIETFKDIELILACGDLPYYYIEKLIRTYKVPALFVRGNHDHALEYSKNGPQSAPLGAIDLHKSIVVLNQIIFLGLEGSLRYKEGPFMYSQLEMWLNVLSLVPRLLINKLSYGRYIDVVISHSPPWDIHDRDTHIHRGFKALRWLIETFKPSYLYHGHIHIYTEDQEKETIFKKTKVTNTYGLRKSVIRAGKQHHQSHDVTGLSQLLLNNPAEDFRIARRKAALENIWSTLTGSSNHLLQFQQIEEQLNYDTIETLGLKEIPLDSIVASVNRQKDFTRKFFPREGVDPHRWQRVYKAVGKQALPIDVYQIDEVYVVLDGNHRVSIARQRGQSHILANVTKIESAVPISPDDRYDDIIIKNQQAQFLSDTKINELFPELDFSVTTPGLYRQLRDQVSMHHFQLELEHHYPYTYEEAVKSWVDEVYLPVVQALTQQGLLRDFPNRTPTDLYLWLVNYQQELSHHFGWQIKTRSAGEELAKTYSKRLIRRWQRFKQRVFSSESLQPISIGNWRRTHLIPQAEGQIFSSVLVAINGTESGWQALDQALTIAKYENASINALHVTSEKVDPTVIQFRKLQNKFRARVEKENVPSQLFIEEGEVVPQLNIRARWNDLLVFSLAHPPEDKPISRLRSGLRTLIQTCPRPLLAVPSHSPMKHALLAYDGSPKSTEALFLAAYLVQQWGIQLTVVTALEDSSMKFNPLVQAKHYLDSRGIEANLIDAVGPPATTILQTMKIQSCDFLVAGGYGHKPVVEVLLGSTIDTLLRESEKPILICH